MENSYPKIFVIILNWNGYSDTIECINSVKQINYPNYELFIVDNGSIDNSEEIIREAFPDLTIIQTGENLGFAGGNNIGVKYAFNSGADYVVLLNNDTIVDNFFLDELVTAVKKTPSIGIASSMIYFYDKPDIIWFAGSTFNLKTGWAKHINHNKKDIGHFKEIVEIDKACGCAMMISKKVYQTVGLMNNDYFCYCEETDWCIRAKKAGFKIVLAPDSKVWHKIFASSGGIQSGAPIYYALRNTLKCLKDNAPYKFWFQNLLRELFVILIFLGSLFTMKVPKRIGIMKVFKGANDYYRGKFGK